MEPAAGPRVAHGRDTAGNPTQPPAGRAGARPAIPRGRRPCRLGPIPPRATQTWPMARGPRPVRVTGHHGPGNVRPELTSGEFGGVPG